MSQGDFNRPIGDIVTLLDSTPRDFQDGDLFPLSSDTTWWLPDASRRIQPYSLSIQQFPFRGPTGFGQRFTFDIASVSCGDLLSAIFVQIELSHWLDDTTILRLQSGKYVYGPGEDQWFYANSLGTVIVEKAEFEVNDQTLETIDGDCMNVISRLFSSINSQYGVGIDGLGRTPLAPGAASFSPYPTQSGTLMIPLPFFFARVALQESFPLLAVKEGSVRVHITLRPFHECVRILTANGASRRDCLTQTPLDTPFIFTTAPPANQVTVQSSATPPTFKKIQLLTYSAHTDGSMRQQILRKPFEVMTRTFNTFTFSEPLKYLINKTASDVIQVQLPLEVNHPMEEILWFIRRKATANTNEWNNYSSVLEQEYDPVFNPRRPLLRSAAIQCNGIELIRTDESWFRQHISRTHAGGFAAYENFIYGYSFATSPGQHQPSGTANASRLQTIRLTLDVYPPGGDFEKEWEVKVFVSCLEWIRFQDGLCNRMFID
jgi:hypothetical protein